MTSSRDGAIFFTWKHARCGSPVPQISMKSTMKSAECSSDASTAPGYATSTI